MAGKFINQLEVRKPDGEDLSIFFDKATNDTAQATIADIVQSGLPTGTMMGELLAWSSNTNDWSPIPFAPQAAALAGGAPGSIPYQIDTNNTSMLPIGTAGQVLTVGAGGVAEWKNAPNPLPAYTAADAGKMATVKADGTGVEWGSVYQAGWYEISDKNPPMVVPANAVFSSGLTSANVANIIRVNGSVSGSSTTLTEMNFYSLMTCGGFTISNFPELTSVNLPALTSTRTISFTNCPKITSVDLTNLSICSQFGFTNMIGLTSFNCQNLFQCGGGINFTDCPELSAVTFHELINAGSLGLYRLQKLSQLYVPKLSYIVSSIDLESLDALKTVEMPRISECTAISASGLPELTSFNLPRLEYLNQDWAGNVIAFTSNTPKLTTFTLGSSLRKVGKGIGNVTMTSCALNQASVDGLLARLAALDGTGGTTIFSNRAVNITGTSAAPSATGQTARSTLVARGCTVTTN